MATALCNIQLANRIDSKFLSLSHLNNTTRSSAIRFNKNSQRKKHISPRVGDIRDRYRTKHLYFIFFFLCRFFSLDLKIVHQKKKKQKKNERWTLMLISSVRVRPMSHYAVHQTFAAAHGEAIYQIACRPGIYFIGLSVILIIYIFGFTILFDLPDQLFRINT